MPYPLVCERVLGWRVGRVVLLWKYLRQVSIHQAIGRNQEILLEHTSNYIINLSVSYIKTIVVRLGLHCEWLVYVLMCCTTQTELTSSEGLEAQRLWSV